MTHTELDSIEAIAKEGFVINPQTALKLIADLRKAIGLLEDALDSWGDYAPKGGKARKTLDNIRAALSELNTKGTPNDGT